MTDTINEVLEFVKESDTKFIRLGFCDPQGFQKNISIMPDDLLKAFETGVPFDASAIKGFNDAAQSDLLLFPDPVTLTVLPWRPGPGRVIRFYCDIKNPDGSPFESDSRYILKNVVRQYEELGYVCKIGAECEFYLFKTDENGDPTTQTLDRGGYLDISPLDKGENIRREVCLCLQEMGIKPESSHHSCGPGQNEIEFKLSDALTCADNLITFKSVVKAIAARNGLFASFMPKPIPNSAGSGLHVSLSLSMNGINIFKNGITEHSKTAESFIAGILEKTSEISLFLTPNANSYERLGKFEAPKYISWSHQNRSQLIRIPAALDEKIRMELRSPDPSLNPYLAFALILAAGLEGIKNGLPLPAPIDTNLYTLDENTENIPQKLPESLGRAISLAENSPFVEKVIGKGMLAKYLAIKKNEAAAFSVSEDRDTFFKDMYFDIL